MKNYKKLLAVVSGAVILAGSTAIPTQAVSSENLYVITQDPEGATSGVFLRSVFSEPGQSFGMNDLYHTNEMDAASAEWWVVDFGGGLEVAEGYLPVVSDYDAFDQYGRIYLNDQPNRNWGSTEIRIGSTCTQTADGVQSSLSSSLIFTDQLTTVCEGSGTFGRDTVDVRVTQEFQGSFARWTVEAKSPNGSVSDGLYLFLGGDVGNDKIYANSGVTGGYYWDTVV